MKPMPLEWRIQAFPAPPISLDILDPSGELLHQSGAEEERPANLEIGPWPKGARQIRWFLTPSGRRFERYTSVWRDGEFRPESNDPRRPMRIMIDLDYGGAYAWAGGGMCSDLAYLLSDEPGALGLEAAFEKWQWRYEDNLFGDSVALSGGWHAMKEDGLALCLELARWAGPDGCIHYLHPPDRFACGKRPLVLLWEPND